MLATRVTHGALWFSAPRRKLDVPCDPSLRERTAKVIDAVASMLDTGRLPDVVHDARCQECQFLGYCLPDVVANSRRLTTYVEREVFACES
jgi:CRISPR/Cas system-associated exonuclease Cas4 (RecB family)